MKQPSEVPGRCVLGEIRKVASDETKQPGEFLVDTMINGYAAVSFLSKHYATFAVRTYRAMRIGVPASRRSSPASFKSDA